MSRTASTSVALIATWAFLAAGAAAQPLVNHLSGPVVDAAPLQIHGLHFGTRAGAAPLRYDDFNGGAIGAEVAGGWETEANAGGAVPTYSGAVERVPGELTAHFGFDATTTSCTLGYPDLATPFLYVSAWVYTTASGEPSPVAKLFSLRDAALQPVCSQVSLGSIPPMCLLSVTAEGGTATNAYGDCARLRTDGAWQRLELFVDFGIGGGLSGEAVLDCDLQEWAAVRGVEWPYGMESSANFSFGESVTVAGAGTLNRYLDEIYLDATPARVELGDAATWTGCSHREIQLPTAWSDQEISIVCNRGAFAVGETVYLFVVDAEGRAGAGFPVAVADETPIETPGTPSTPVLD